MGCKHDISIGKVAVELESRHSAGPDRSGASAAEDRDEEEEAAVDEAASSSIVAG